VVKNDKLHSRTIHGYAKHLASKFNLEIQEFTKEANEQFLSGLADNLEAEYVLHFHSHLLDKFL
jgi:hypothetical protein